MINRSWLPRLTYCLVMGIFACFLSACDLAGLSVPTSLPLPDLGNRDPDTPVPIMTAQADESPRGGIVINLPPTWTPAPAASQNQSPVPVPELQQTTAEDVQTYEVQVGDTLAEIALVFNVPMDVLIRANNLADPDHIEVGQILFIPPR